MSGGECVSAILPGSYDPVTLGHLDIIKRAAEKEDTVYAVVFINPEKEYMFPLLERVAMLMLATENIPNCLVSYSTGRVVDYMREHDIERIIKGIRNSADIEYERPQAEYNFHHGGYETEFFEARPEYQGLSSTAVREALIRGEAIDGLVPGRVGEYIKKLQKDGKM